MKTSLYLRQAETREMGVIRKTLQACAKVETLRRRDALHARASGHLKL